MAVKGNADVASSFKISNLLDQSCTLEGQDMEIRASDAYSPPLPLALQYSDAVSSVYPDRPIRPLPKRRIRSRLSPDLAESILQSSPSAPQERLFSLPYYSNLSNGGRSVSQNSSLEVQASDTPDADPSASYQFRGNEVDSERVQLKVNAKPYNAQSRASSMGTTTSPEGYVVPKNDMLRSNRQQMAQSTASSADSVDGYDSFENTNNKKKRKIPATGGHQSSLSAEMASLGLSSSRDVEVPHTDLDRGLGHYYGTGASAIPNKSSASMSGAARSRYGRVGARRRSARSPLGVSFNGPNYPRREHYPATDMIEKEPAQGGERGREVISAGLANADASPDSPGQENASILPQTASNASNPEKNQFTFTCGSDAGKGMTWPGYPYPVANGAYQSNPLRGADGTYDAYNSTRVSQDGQAAPSQANPAAAHANATSMAPQPNKTKRPLSKQYAMAARDRRLRQNYNNFHHPPKEEDVWICEYCEYEAIFGRPPEALMRQYEIKDRRERRRLAEKRRLLEKAKMKGRKGKKGNKNGKGANSGAQATQSNQKQRYDPNSTEDSTALQQATQSDDYLLDEYDDDPLSTPTLPPQTPSRIPQPVVQNPSHSLRPPSGSGSLRQSVGSPRAS